MEGRLIAVNVSMGRGGELVVVVSVQENGKKRHCGRRLLTATALFQVRKYCVQSVDNRSHSLQEPNTCSPHVSIEAQKASCMIKLLSA